jgi:hypothetical protein
MESQWTISSLQVDTYAFIGWPNNPFLDNIVDGWILVRIYDILNFYEISSYIYLGTTENNVKVDLHMYELDWDPAVCF